MAFFVEKRKEKSESNSKTITSIEIDLLAVGKRAGLTFTEMNELRVKDLLDLVKSYMGKENEGSREATQDDIDKFYA